MRRHVFGCGKELARADARAIFGGAEYAEICFGRGRELARADARAIFGLGCSRYLWQGISTSGCSRYLWVRSAWRNLKEERRVLLLVKSFCVLRACFFLTVLCVKLPG